MIGLWRLWQVHRSLRRWQRLADNAYRRGHR